MVSLAPDPFNLSSSSNRAAQSRRGFAALCEFQSRYMGARSSRICESNALHFVRLPEEKPWHWEVLEDIQVSFLDPV
jgi:hypothetical protein